MATTPNRAIRLGSYLVNVDHISSANMQSVNDERFLEVRMADGVIIPVKGMDLEGLANLMNGDPF